MVDDELNNPPTKRSKISGGGSSAAIVPAFMHDDDTPHTNIRTSSLNAPTLQLTGHTGSVYALAYSPSGNSLCSASFDKRCFLWNHTDGDYNNYNILEGHKNAILDCKWFTSSLSSLIDGNVSDNDSTDSLVNDDSTQIVTVSADRTLLLWDAHTGARIRKWEHHTGVVNACSILSAYTCVSVSDDAICCLWDRRQKSAVAVLDCTYPTTAVAAGVTQVFTGGIDNLITCWDVNMRRKVYSMKGHTDTITCLALHPEGTHVLSNSMDNTLQTWDIRSYVEGRRHVKTFVGHKHNAEKGLLKCAWSPDGNMVTAGSADRLVHIWDDYSGEELYLLPGHKGCVNTVIFHPTENVIASGASDKQIFVGELS